jgi:hypothetical protein
MSCLLFQVDTVQSCMYLPTYSMSYTFSDLQHREVSYKRIENTDASIFRVIESWHFVGFSKSFEEPGFFLLWWCWTFSKVPVSIFKVRRMFLLNANSERCHSPQDQSPKPSRRAIHVPSGTEIRLSTKPAPAHNFQYQHFDNYQN